jgi:hypothetical protein
LKTVKGYKLFRLRKNGTLGSLFINRRAVLPEDTWMEAADHPTRGYTRRPGWHVLRHRHAPHLSTKGRVWRQVEVADYTEMVRPESQGGIWLLAGKLRILPEGETT